MGAVDCAESLTPGGGTEKVKRHTVKNDELRLCGLAAVRARWRRDPQSIRRLFFDEATARKIGVMTKAMAGARRVYRCVGAEELARIAGSVHHGGIVAVVAGPRLAAPKAEDLRRWAARGEGVLVLDRVGNAHNLGALARTAAFFGVAHLVVAMDPAAAKPNDAAYRVAEGGLEAIACWAVPDVAAFVRSLRAAGYAAVGAATRGGRAPSQGGMPEGAGPVALVLGNEEHGLAAAVVTACSHLVTLAGNERVESLNVSVAGAVLMWEAFARRR